LLYKYNFFLVCLIWFEVSSSLYYDSLLIREIFLLRLEATTRLFLFLA
jgi:hypothetical protein